MKNTKGSPFRARNQSGYALAWVMVVTLVASIIIAPFLSWMLTSLTSAHHQLYNTQEYYAADSGIEDAVYKMQMNYTAKTEVSEDVAEDIDIIKVGSTADFPPKGVIQIEAELIYYNDKAANGKEFLTLSWIFGRIDVLR